jgi:nicotinamide riboside kinase
LKGIYMQLTSIVERPNPIQQEDTDMSEAKVRARANKKAIISLVTMPNPKRNNTLARKRYDLYVVGMTVAEYIAAGGRSGDVNNDVAEGYIALTLP